jgi:hypothetical protein
MKFIASLALAVALLVASAARADSAGIDMSGTSPSSVTTSVGYTTSTELGVFSTCSGYAVIQGGTGGTLDIYIQTAFKKVNATPTWVDVAHFPQLAGGAAAAGFTFTLTRWSPTTSAFFTPVNTVSGTPVLAVNTVVPGILGYLLRVVYKTGAGTSAGAAQSVLVFCSST